MRLIRLRFIGVVVCLVLAFYLIPHAPVLAQDNILISLESGTLELQTGQRYDINLRLDDANDVWLMNAEISYDPAVVYVIGTKSGSPVRQAAMFDGNNSVTVRNAIQDKHILYTLSMTAPGTPVSGNGVVGTFTIYPLAAGTTQLTFSRVTLSKINPVLENGTPVKIDSEDLPFTPILLELHITGNTMPEPSEATATPAPTQTPIPMTSEARPTLEPTLVNATAAPRAEVTPTPLTLAEVPVADNSSGSPIVLVAVVIIAIAVVGLAALFIVGRRSR